MTLLKCKGAIALCALLLCIPTLAPAKIVFYSTRDGVGSIYVMDDDGSEDAEAQGRTDLPALTGGDPCGWRSLRMAILADGDMSRRT